MKEFPKATILPSNHAILPTALAIGILFYLSLSNVLQEKKKKSPT
jgi:hypothetical protein